MTIEQNKVSKPYSLNPVVVAWVTQRAARLTIEGAGRRISDSEVANDILTKAMEEDKHLEILKAKIKNGGKQLKQLRAES